MVAKLVLALVAVLLLIAIITAAAYRYLDKQAERKHEEEMVREQRYREALDHTSIDAELERERERDQ